MEALNETLLNLSLIILFYTLAGIAIAVLSMICYQRTKIHIAYHRANKARKHRSSQETQFDYRVHHIYQQEPYIWE